MYLLDYEEEMALKSLGEYHEQLGKDHRDKELIMKMLKDGKKPEAISEFCGYPLQQILHVQERMIYLKTDDLKMIYQFSSRSIEKLQRQAVAKARKEEQDTQIKNMLLCGKMPEEIADYCDYPLEQILEVKSSVEKCCIVEEYADKKVKEEQFHQISKMLSSGKTPEAIIDFCPYSPELVYEVANNLKDLT